MKDNRYTWDEFTEAAQAIELDGLTGDTCGCLLSAIARHLSGAPIADVGYTNAYLFEPDPFDKNGRRRIGEIDVVDGDYDSVNSLVTSWVRLARQYKTEEIVPIGETAYRKKIEHWQPVPVEQTLAVLASYGIKREA